MCRITQVLLLIVLIVSNAYGQLEMTNEEVLLAKFEFQKKNNAEQLLFLHLDKTTHEINERIWFSS